MAAFRYMLAVLNYFKNVTPVVPQKSLSVPPHLLFSLQHKDLSSDCPVIEKTAMHHWNGTIMLLVGAPKILDEKIMRLGIKEGVKHVAHLNADKSHGETLQIMLCHECKDGDKVKYFNCDVRNEQQLTSTLQSVLRNKNNSYVIVNNVNFLNYCKSKDEIDNNVAAFVKSSLTAIDLMRTDKDGQGGAIINMIATSPSSPNPGIESDAKRSMDIIQSSNLGHNEDRAFSKTGVRVMTVFYGAPDNDIKGEEKRIPTGAEVLQKTDHITKSAAEAVIDIYKVGENGTTWLSKETKPAEDITFITKKVYGVPSEREEDFTQRECA